jgi:methyl-accepting chemotaxis protein
MIAGNLDTTNILLGIMAAVSLLEALVLIAAAVMGYRLYRQAMRTVRDIEQHQIAPLAARVDAVIVKIDGILGDLKDVTARVTRGTERVDSAINSTMRRMDETAHRVRASIAARIGRVVGLAQSAKGAFWSLLNGRRKAA